MQTATDRSTTGNDSGPGSVHRFHDKVAINLPGGETVYMTKEEARELANGLYRCSLDVARQSFTHSEFSGVRTNSPSP